MTNPMARKVKPINGVLSSELVPRTPRPNNGPNKAIRPIDVKNAETLLIIL